MEKNGVLMKSCILLTLYAFSAAICSVHCVHISTDATKTFHKFRSWKHTRSSNVKSTRKFHQTKRRLEMNLPLDSSNTDPYVSSPFSLPPYESLPPFPFPENTPPFCVYPPLTPLPPSTVPSPEGPTYGPPQSGPIPNPPIIIPSPPSVVPNPPTNVPTGPTPTQPVFSPPYYAPSPPSYEPSPPYYEPSPPSYEPSPPFITPSPYGFVPSPRVFLPPIVFPPPTVPPPPHMTPITATWCVAKASVPDPIIEEAMNYACGSGADCDQIQSAGSCFEPNTLFAHASYAFNSYWQRTKVAGGTCDFGGTAILVTVDPSYDGCHFLYL
ncbi:uncharacterized protein [Primulina eburnea]|uniref:uncharacterized protein isoform X1 n=1 Tax=Primulina eburnea TaxID=1245227 RepID=UPI003C6C7EAA